MSAMPRPGPPIAGKSPDNRIGLAFVIAIHALALYGLVRLEAVRSALHEIAPVFVNLIAPEPEVKPQVIPPPPVPRPKPRRDEPPPLLTTQAVSDTPSAIEVPPPKEAPPQPPAPMQAVEVPAPVTPPNFTAAYLDNPAPVYPPLARRAGEQGRVLLRVYVSGQGGALEVNLSRSSGSQRLDAAALEAVRRWRFIPARQGEKPVAAWVLVPISFQLEG